MRGHLEHFAGLRRCRNNTFVADNPRRSLGIHAPVATVQWSPRAAVPGFADAEYAADAVVAERDGAGDDNDTGRADYTKPADELGAERVRAGHAGRCGRCGGARAFVTGAVVVIACGTWVDFGRQLLFRFSIHLIIPLGFAHPRQSRPPFLCYHSTRIRTSIFCRIGTVGSLSSFPYIYLHHD